MVNGKSLEETIRSIYGEGTYVKRRRSVSGGDINRAYALELSDGNTVFMKANRKENQDFFRAEAEGLSAMKSTKTVRVPEVIASGIDTNGSFLLLEYIQSGSGGKRSSEELGTALARMHMADTGRFVKNGNFGFTADNYIGAGEQINTAKETWTDFFINCRLRPQFKSARQYFDKRDGKNIDIFLSKVEGYLSEPMYPSLLHGDLWAGNYMIDKDGHPWLIDPAAYVGHHEADLAMTELFGGFDRYFYDAYRSTAGIDSGYKERRDLYNLYHLLNHLNLFGGGYLHSVRSIISRYI
jgi:fructosamine-3-kinase